MSLRLSAVRSFTDVGHDHFSDSELANAAGKAIDKTSRKFIDEPAKRNKNSSLKFISRKKFSTRISFHEKFNFDPKFLTNFRLIDICTAFTLPPLSQQHHHLYFTLQIINKRYKNYKFHRCFRFFASLPKRLQNNE